MVKSAVAPVLSLLIIALLGSCTSSSPATESSPLLAGETRDTVTVVVTRDFGKEAVLEKSIQIEADTSAMAALQTVADVETKYGGGYVETIDGIGPESRAADKDKDWFIYVNGIASNLGARDYILRDGDVEHWDFRDWSYQQFIPAIIGDFPQPFRSGFQEKKKPTIIIYEPAYSADAEDLVTMMKRYDINEVSAIRSDQLADEARENGNLVIITKRGNPLISELSSAGKKLGFYAYFEPDSLTVLDAAGNTAFELKEGGGLIQATQNPWSPSGVGSGESVVWMVTGYDDDGVKSAVAVLLENQDDLRHAFAAVVDKGRVVKIP